MPLVQTQYPLIREQISAGDMIAFSGKGGISEIIKTLTRAGVSHVAAVLRTGVNGDERIQVIESTQMNGFTGVSVNFLSQRLNNYSGEVWWFPLSDRHKATFNIKVYYDWLLKQEGKPYDYCQAIKAAMDALNDFGGLTYAKEDFDKFLCSELMAGALEEGGAISHLNASEVLPIDLCRFNIWRGDYYQLKGEPRRIKGVNSQEATGFGER